jgi:hypothetical protein
MSYYTRGVRLVVPKLKRINTDEKYNYNKIRKHGKYYKDHLEESESCSYEESNTESLESSKESEAGETYESNETECSKCKFYNSYDNEVYKYILIPNGKEVKFD